MFESLIVFFMTDVGMGVYWIVFMLIMCMAGNAEKPGRVRVAIFTFLCLLIIVATVPMVHAAERLTGFDSIVRSLLAAGSAFCSFAMLCMIAIICHLDAKNKLSA